MAVCFWIALHTVWFAEGVIRRRRATYATAGYAILQSALGSYLLHAELWLPFLVGNIAIASAMIARGLVCLAEPPGPDIERKFEVSVWRGVTLAFATAIAMTLS